jgi:hypothetical protein
MEIQKNLKNLQRFVCEDCDFKCYMKIDWERHVLRPKHKNNMNRKTLGINLDDKKTLNLKKTYTCNCGKIFKSQSGLWKHKQKVCFNEENTETNETLNKYTNEKEFVDKDLVLMLLKQNAELLEIVKNGTHNTTNNNSNNNNCNNKTFNLQVFLNETCKDAMNIMDFVDSIKLQLSDLESVGELGYVKGLSNIIVKNLRALDITQRPVHCSDAKREILYVKDNDVWEKEDPENTKMKKAVKYIAYKNTKLLPLWKQTYPDCQDYYSSKSDKYNYMVIEAMGGAGDNEGEKINKIIKQIAKEVVIEK